jgi:Family of unknown function (DUF6433)
VILSISEILELTNKIHKRQDQIDFLRRHDSVPLRGILKFALDPSIVWLLPPGAPPYKPCEALDQEGQLYRKARELLMFIKGGGYDGLRAAKRETLFISFLESITPGDAELMTFVKDKMINFPDVTVGLIQEAFPGLLGPIQDKTATTIAEAPIPHPAASVEAPIVSPKMNGPLKPEPELIGKKKRIRKKKNEARGKSGFKNVNFNKQRQKWVAERMFEGKKYHIGFFDDARVADMAVEIFCKEKGIVR